MSKTIDKLKQVADSLRAGANLIENNIERLQKSAENDLYIIGAVNSNLTRTMYTCQQDMTDAIYAHHRRTVLKGEQS